MSESFKFTFTVRERKDEHGERQSQEQVASSITLTSLGGCLIPASDYLLDLHALPSLVICSIPPLNGLSSAYNLPSLKAQVGALLCHLLRITYVISRCFLPVFGFAQYVYCHLNVLVFLKNVGFENVFRSMMS